MRASGRLRKHASTGGTEVRSPRYRQSWRVSAVAVITAGALIALAAPAAAHIQNPGSFTFSESNAALSLGLLPVPLPSGSMAGQIDADGNITIPDSTLGLTDQPFSDDLTVGTSDVSLSGTATIATGSMTGTLDPGSGAMSLDTSLFASVTFTGTVDGSQVYSGTCSIRGSAPADQLPVKLTTDPPGVPYSEQTGAVTLAANLGDPIVCDPALPSPLDFVFNGSNSGLTVPGTTTPILLQDARLSVSPDPVNFGDVQVGSSKTLTVTFSNSGTDPTFITGLSTLGTSEFFMVFGPALTCQQGTTGLIVPAGGSCSVDVTFAPASTGVKSGSLRVRNTSSDGTQLIPLTGTGINPGLSASPGSLSFGQQVVGTTSATMAVTIASTGTTDLTVTEASASGDFAADASACTSQPIAPGNACVISVSFSPTATGSRSGTLTIKSNALSSPDTVSLSGTGIAPVISVTPSKLQFGSVLVTATSAPQNVTVANAGDSPLTVKSAVTSGPFAVSDDACSGAGAIAPGGICQIAVVFTPSGSGPASGTLTVSSDGGTATVALSGSGSPVADLSVSIGASPNPVKRKNNLTYAITAANAGPSAAAGPVVTDVLPSNVQFESLAAPSGSSCVTPAIGATGTVKCNIGSLSSGATAQLTIVVLVVAPRAMTIADTVKVTSSATDPDLTDNQATVSTVVK
jgi:uncharacterized repeat protein (TIGR01451 family)